MKIFGKALLTIIILLLTAIVSANFSSKAFGTIFPDLAEDVLYYPHIQKLFNQHFVAGDTRSGTYRPKDTINRGEFAKITAYTRLGEEYGISHNWIKKDNMGMAYEIMNILKPYFGCTQGACANIGGIPFTDVKESNPNCIENFTDPNACEPWYSRYIYYAVSKGYIKGYTNANSTKSFKPTDNILRIHALKMVIADNGNIAPENDIRYKRLLKQTESLGSYSPKCLKGAENYIKDLNGGNQSDAEKLLKYALLADRLDLFGNNCDVFGNYKTPKERALFLNRPLTREETPRYFSITTSYKPAKPDVTDPTINTVDKNNKSLASDRTYRLPDYKQTDLYNNQGADESIWGNNTTNSQQTDTENVTASKATNKTTPVPSKSAKSANDNKNTPANNTPINQYDTIKPFSYFAPVGTKIRICETSDTSKCYDYIVDKDLNVDENNSVNGETVNGLDLWYVVTINGKIYYISWGELDGDEYTQANTAKNLTNSSTQKSDTQQNNIVDYEAEKQKEIITSNLGSGEQNKIVPDSPNWAEPINVLTGNFWSEKTDLSMPTRGQTIEIKRTYNAQNLIKNPLGIGWSFEYDIKLSSNQFADKIITFGDGRSLYFSRNIDGKYISKNYEELIISDDGAYYRAKNGTKYEFFGNGDLISIKDRFDNGIYFDKSNKNIGVIKDDTGPLFYIKYDKNNRIKRITDKGGRRVTYYYDDAGNLTKVKNPMGGIYEYSYDEKHRLLTIKNELGHVMIANIYDDKDRVVEQADVMSGVSKLTYFEGRTDLTDPMGYTRSHFYNENYQTTAEIDTLGNKKEFIYNAAGFLEQLITQNGAKTTFEYDEYGNRTKITDALGNVTTYTYNKDSQITSITDARGAISAMTYDDNGMMTKSVDAMGNVTEFKYNKFGQRIKQINPKGTVTKWIYNKDGILKQSIDAMDNVTEYTYNNIRQLIASRDAEGGTTYFRYNKKGDLIKQINALGKSSAIIYDKAGNKIKEINENGSKTKYAYDDKNRLTRETNANGEKTEYIYDLNDHLVKLKDENGYISFNEYDSEGRLISIKNPEGAITSYEYDKNGNKTAMTDGNGNRTAFEYDALDRLTKTTDPMGAVTGFAYDANGNLIETTDAGGNKVIAKFDILNRLTGSIGQLGDETNYKFDEAGNKIAMTDPLGNTVNFQYDINGNLIEKINADGGYTKYKTDKLGRVTEETDAIGNKTITAYDALGRVISITDALGKTTKFKYDSIGNRIAVIDALGNKTRFYFDKLNRLTKVKDAMNGTIKNKYDKKGNIIKITDAKGADLYYEYNSSGLITRAINEDGLITEFKYDKNENRVQESLRADKITQNNFYTFDSLNRVISATDSMRNTVKTEYDLLGNKVTEINAMGANIKNEFDANGRLIKTIDAFGNSQINTYDLNGNLISSTDLNGNKKQFAYDTENRLISMTDPAGNTLKYTYDAVGNKIATIDPTGIKTSYKFDANGRMTATLNKDGNGEIYEYDSLGNKISQYKISKDGTIFGKTVYTYDALRRITSATDALGGTVKYAYDKNSNRTKITDQNGAVSITEFDLINRPSKTKDALGNTETYKYDRFGNLIALTDKNGVTESREYDALNRVIRKQKGDIIITQKYDALGNITSIADNNGEIKSEYNKVGFLTKTTDANGNETKYEYDNTGAVIKRTDLSGTLDYKYNNRNLIEQIAFTQKGDKNAHLFKYSYDPRGMNTDVIYPDGAQTTNKYDELGHLITIKTNDKISMNYEYNDFDMKTKSVTLAGDIRTEELYDYDNAGRLAKWTKDGKSTEYNYDPAYNRVSVTADGKTSNYAYNQLNQLVANGTSNYRYDKNGNLIKIINSDATDADPGSTAPDAGSTALSGASIVDTDVNLTWDPLNRLTSYNSSDTAITYSYDSLNRMTARNSTKFEYAGLANQFVIQSESGTDTTYLYDMNGSPLAWYNQNRPHAFLKNAHNDVVSSLGDDGLGGVTGYEPFGGIKSKIETLPSTSSASNENSKSDNLGFQGQFTDSDSNLSFLGARVYNTDTAQFLSPDSFPAVAEEPGSTNRYTYSHNDPVNFWDSTGAYGLDVHYGKTLDWARNAAEKIGFNSDMTELLAQNIASFNQYHDKEWSLAPNNYGDFDNGMNSKGQGNTLHFQNPNRDYMSYAGLELNIANEYKPAGTNTNFTIKGWTDFVDPLTNGIRVSKTIIPVYQMFSLTKDNAVTNAKTGMFTDPREAHGKFYGNLELIGGNISERLQYAVNSHDPRLFGIALHEYQDTFAHAGFNKWHGFSHKNDWFIDSDNEFSTANLSKSGARRSITDTSISLERRDLFMQTGTEYWLNKFFESQAGYYNGEIQKTKNYNKEEDVANNTIRKASAVLGINQPDSEMLYGTQGVGKGKSPCIEYGTKIVSNAIKRNKINWSLAPTGCDVFIEDWGNEINNRFN